MDWEVKLSHVFRELNKATDMLGNFVVSYSCNLEVFLFPLDCCKEVVLDDMRDVFTPMMALV